MKKLILLATLIALTAACSKGDRKAAHYLTQAQTAYDNAQYHRCMALIDSIKVLYPKAFDTRQKGQALYIQASRKALAQHMDTLQMQRQQVLHTIDSLKQKLTYERDTAYEAMGHYLHPTQVIERNLHRSFLRLRARDDGRLFLTSIYCGKGNIHHNAVRVSAGDDTYAETSPSPDCYETTDLGWHIEKADYPNEGDRDVIAYVVNHADRNIRVQYRGERNYITQMSADDRKAFTALWQIAGHLKQLKALDDQLQECQRKQAFIDHKLKEAPAPATE